MKDKDESWTGRLQCRKQADLCIRYETLVLTNSCVDPISPSPHKLQLALRVTTPYPGGMAEATQVPRHPQVGAEDAEHFRAYTEGWECSPFPHVARSLPIAVMFRTIT